MDFSDVSFRDPSAILQGPLRILLIEDDEFDVAVFRRAFRKADIPCEIIRCRRAEEALEGLRDTNPTLDLLVTDHKLPGMSGLELCLELLAKRADFALVLMTGGGSEQVAIQALKAGVHDYIVKDMGQEYLELLPLVLPQAARRHRDRMARRRAERELRYSRDAALEAARVKGRLLASDGEAIRLAMGDIHQATERLRSTRLDADQERELAALERAADTLSGVIDEILEISALEPQKVEWVRTHFSLARLIEETIHGSSYPQDVGTLAFGMAPDVPEKILGDPGRLRQVLTHLVGYVAALPGVSAVSLQVEVEGPVEAEEFALEEPEVLRFSVIFKGGGLTDDVRRRLREAFRPVDESVARLPGGIGVDLAICVHLVQLMNGAMGFERDTFHFTLPIRPEAPPRPASAQVGTARATAGGGAGAENPRDELLAAIFQPDLGLQVMIVQENPVVTHVTSKLLEELGCRFIAVQNGRQAMEALGREPFDVILTGIQRRDAFEICGPMRQRARPAKAPRTVILGLAVDEQLGQRCQEAGMDGWVPRPIERDSLRRALMRVVPEIKD